MAHSACSAAAWPLTTRAGEQGSQPPCLLLYGPSGAEAAMGWAAVLGGRGVPQTAQAAVGCGLSNVHVPQSHSSDDDMEVGAPAGGAPALN